MNSRNFFVELKRRNVYKVAVAYAIVAWLLIQGASILFPTFEAPPWVMKVFVTAIIFGFPVALILAWAFELTPEGIKRAEDVAPDESITGRTGQKLVGITIVLAVIAGGLLAFQFLRPKSAATAVASTAIAPSSAAIPAKSIAVLPFENRSEDKANAYFADGIQDEILTRLSKIAELKVISRTSTQHYKSAPENLPEIARQLGVAHILEGSVQKSGDAVRVIVQLIKAADDSHLWAEIYDRKLTDIFGVESDVAKAIADVLQAKLTGQEKTTLDRKPTTNLEAYDSYLRGLAFSLRPSYDPEDNLNAIKYFDEAVKLDPKFALAWAWLAHENALGYFNRIGDDFTALREAAKLAADKVIELQPNLGDAYLAQGYVHYYCERDYDSAIVSFEKAAKLSPNNSEIPRALGRVCRRKGQWQRSLEYFRQAIELDPRDASLLSDQIDIFWNLRQFSAALKACDQILDIIPGNSDTLATKASIYQAQGNLPAAAAFLSTLHPETKWWLFRMQIHQLMYERRYADAIAALKTEMAKPHNAATEWENIANKALLAWLQQLSGDAAAARVTWQQVRSEVERFRRVKGEDFFTETLASAYVALGDKAKAFAIMRGEESWKLNATTSKDAMAQIALLEMMAKIAVQAGERDLALDQLAICAQNPASEILTYGDLKLSPLWDSLRGDPRFEKIVASLAPKDAKSK